jgi:tRNA-dihydrouridine synthase A
MSRYPHKMAVAPMMDWTDRHCRYFHRRLTRRALLHTEMIAVDAIIHGDRRRLLDFDADERPVAIQLGGADPRRLAEAAKIAADWGYDEINLNVGCPSDRVQSGRFGACLMREPELVGDLVAAAKAAVALPVTVKCRLGVDEQDPDQALGRLAEAVVSAGTEAIWVHARKAWLAGLSPKQNREIPPLDYARVVALKQRFPATFIGVNGGIRALDEAAALLARVDGVMLGRAAYHNPAILAAVDHAFYASCRPAPDAVDAALAMLPYIARELSRGTRLAAVIRPMLGLFQATPGARRWRQVLTVEAIRPGAGVATVEAALAAVVHGRERLADAPAASTAQIPALA